MARDELKVWAAAHPNMPQAVAVLQLLQYVKDLEYYSGLKANYDPNDFVGWGIKPEQECSATPDTTNESPKNS